jgi:hypothetical protein
VSEARPLPDAVTLTRAQHSGWACCFCGASLAAGGVLAGRAEGRMGAHDMSVDVYACPPRRGCGPERRRSDANPRA